MILQHICTVLQEGDFKFLRFIVKVGHLMTEPWNHCDRKLFIRETGQICTGHLAKNRNLDTLALRLFCIDFLGFLDSWLCDLTEI